MAYSSVRTRAVTATKPAVRWALWHRLPKTVMNAAARRGDLQGQLFAATTRSSEVDPFEVLERVRASGPLYRGKMAYVAVSHSAVREVLSSSDFRSGIDAGQLSGAIGRASAWSAERGVIGPLEPPSLLVTEPPAHTRYRKLVTRVFSVRAVERLRERTEQIATQLLDSLTGEQVDIVDAYCRLLPVTVIAEILGVPTADRGRVLAFGDGAAPSLDMGLPWRQFREVERALRGFDVWMSAHLERLRREPGDDLLSQLVAVRDDGVGLSELELKSTAGLVLAAGFETTVNLLGNGIALMHEHRDQLDGLLADPSGWGNAVEEILRFDPPVFLTGRTSLRDTAIAGMPVPAGSLVTASLAGANRDPAVFADPARFDVTRPDAREHVAFSAGRHFCLGAALARMEGEVGLRLLFERYPDLRVLPGAARRETRILRGYSRLPVNLGRVNRGPAAPARQPASRASADR